MVTNNEELEVAISVQTAEKDKSNCVKFTVEGGVRLNLMELGCVINPRVGKALSAELADRHRDLAVEVSLSGFSEERARLLLGLLRLYKRC